MREGQRTPRAASCFALVALCLTLPALMGGCPEFQNESVTAIETATRGVLNAGIDLFFDQYRTDAAR